jgi:hypothetical protein
MPEPRREFPIYESISPGFKTDMVTQTDATIVARAGHPNLANKKGHLLWNSTNPGWRLYSGTNYRQPDGTGGWQNET